LNCLDLEVRSTQARNPTDDVRRGHWREVFVRQSVDGGNHERSAIPTIDEDVIEADVAEQTQGQLKIRGRSNRGDGADSRLRLRIWRSLERNPETTVGIAVLIRDLLDLVAGLEKFAARRHVEGQGRRGAAKEAHLERSARAGDQKLLHLILGR